VLFVYTLDGGCLDRAEELGRAHVQDLRGRERKEGRRTLRDEEVRVVMFSWSLDGLGESTCVRLARLSGSRGHLSPIGRKICARLIVSHREERDREKE
jgi:hypothetical protein